VRTRRPIGVTPGQSRFASDSLMTARAAPVPASSSVNSRPSRSATPKVEKYPALTAMVPALAVAPAPSASATRSGAGTNGGQLL
jgi:hypothetical protein